MVEVDSRLAMTAGLARWRPWSRDGPMPVTGRLTAAKCAELVVKKPRNKRVELSIFCSSARNLALNQTTSGRRGSLSLGQRACSRVDPHNSTIIDAVR